MSPARSVNPEFVRWPYFSLDRLTLQREPFLQMSKQLLENRMRRNLSRDSRDSSYLGPGTELSRIKTHGWPGLSEMAATVQSWLTPNDVVESRAAMNPGSFAYVDHFGENEELAVLQGLLVRRRDDEFDHPMAEIHTVTDENIGELYGSLHYPTDPEDFQILLADGLWLQRHAEALMVIQLRIYRFLTAVATDIMSEENQERFRVDNERNPTEWKARLTSPPRPNDNGIQDDDEFRGLMDTFILNRHSYIEQMLTLVPYTSSAEKVVPFTLLISSKHSEEYESRLHLMKARPDKFFTLLFDVHGHSHYVLKGLNGETHPWVSH